jgi:hypothetical protein
MSDLQRSLQLMIKDSGCDTHELKDSKYKLMIAAPSDQMMLCQYECAAETVVVISKCFQLVMPHSPFVLVHLQALINQLLEAKFTMHFIHRNAYIDRLPEA